MLQIKNEKWGGGRKEGENRKMIALVTLSSCLIKLETVGQMQKKGGGGVTFVQIFYFFKANKLF